MTPPKTIAGVYILNKQTNAFLLQVGHGPAGWEASGSKEDAQRLPESHLV